MTSGDLLYDMGMRITTKRKELGMTQEQLAERMEVSTQMISNLENGKKAIRPENLVRLCEALNISADFILRGKYEDYENGIYAEKYEKLSAEKQQLICMIMDSWLQ